MGVTIEAILAYGYDLGGPEHGWLVREADRDGRWTPDWWDHDESFFDAAETRLVNAGVPLEVVAYRHTERKSYILAAHHECAYVGSARQLSDELQLIGANNTRELDDQLYAGCRALGLTPITRPSWLLTVYTEI